MAIPSLSYILGIVVVLYLSTFVIFAILRVATGISIQRLGFSSLRHIAFSPRNGIKIEIRGLGFQIHRPTFAQPTWISLVVEEARLILDLSQLNTPSPEGLARENGFADDSLASDAKVQEHSGAGNPQRKATPTSSTGKHRTWRRLIDLKDKLKRLHRIIPWLRLLDFMAVKSSLVVQGVGSVHVGSLLISVDTRRHAVDRSRLFLHARSKSEEQRPAEWTISIWSFSFEADGKESTEIMDHCVTNIHGFLYKHVEGLRDTSIFVKLGRLHIPYDDIGLCGEKVTRLLHRHDNAKARKSSKLSNKEVDKFHSPPSSPRASDDSTLVMISEARDFIKSALGGIREMSFAVSTFGLSKCMKSVRPCGSPVILSLSLKELGLDVYRLDPSTPAQSMYFSRQDVAHQALLSAISLSMGIDQGQEQPERVLYVPMTTATIKTTLPSKLLQFAIREQAVDLNTNVLFANLVITSPSIDLDTRHLPVVMAMFTRGSSSSGSSFWHKHRLMTDFLPKSSVKLSVQEPVMRISLPSVENTMPDGFDFDLLINSASSISLDVDSSHNHELGAQYSLTSNLRMVSNKLYYQTASKQRHDLLITESIELKAQVTADPEVKVLAFGNFYTFSVFMIRSEINNGIRQIIKQMRADVKTHKLSRPENTASSSFLRKLPPWLQHFQLQGSDFNFEMAGIDKRICTQQRGFTVHVESWNAEYKVRKDEDLSRPTSRRRRASVSQKSAEEKSRPFSPPPSFQFPSDSTDGRRLAFHIRGLETFAMEASDMVETEPFISLPRAEVALTSTSDGRNQLLHVNSLVKSLSVQYSLFRHYCVGLAITMLHRTFSRPVDIPPATTRSASTEQPSNSHRRMDSASAHEFTVVDFKANFIQVKANMPEDPCMMLHLHELELGRHRGLNPFARAHIARLYAEAPGMRRVWSRVVSIKTPRVDLREWRLRHGQESKLERSFDFVSDAIRIGVPNQLVVHKVFDNFVNTVKTVAQLHHRFVTDSDEYILAKNPEPPKQVPRISVRSQMLLLELEDSAFEWKLGVIFRTGLVEQKQRIAREEAFRMKCRKLGGFGSNGKPPGSPRHQGRGRSPLRKADETNNATEQSRGRKRSPSHPDDEKAGRKVRYDHEGMPEVTGDQQRSIGEAYERLKRHNSQSWKQRIDKAMSTQTGHMADLRSLMWGLDSIPDEVDHNETILRIPQRPALASALISDINFVIDKPSFPMSECADFLHRVGKGLPKDTEFSLLIPTSAQFNMGECRVTLRDYPLPLLHIPAIKPGQSPRLPSWSLKTNFVIAEEFRSHQSTKDIRIMVIPPDKLEPGEKRGGFAVDVRRTVSPTKTYSDMKVDINTARDTRITWATSYMPAIQDMMQVVEGFTKPQVDPSERVGFWDKIRLGFHSRIHVAWKGDGDVHLMLKGSRDPYVVTGYGAGFVMIWRNDVKWNIHQEDDPCKFMTVDSGDYVLAVPDYSGYARRASKHSNSQIDGGGSYPNAQENAILKKVIMKLSGKVRWQFGLVFERNLGNGRRTFEFEPHYNVTLRNPSHVKYLQEDRNSYDAFDGFRSNHIHMSIGISAPSDRDWSASNNKPASNYNAVHLTPRFFTHFFAWWSLFSGIMSLPIHQGPIFPGVEKSGKKFSRHLSTIKYSLLLSPLFLSHIYKHKDAEDYERSDDSFAATGLKVKLESYMLDLHQRREEFNSEVKGLNKTVKTTSMRIYQTLLDLSAADIRAVSSEIVGTSAEALQRANTAKLADLQSASQSFGLSAFTIPDNDFSWIDVDDLVEIDWTLPSDADPRTKILPLAYAPRFTYRRDTDHENSISGDPNRRSPFGYEATHPCVMTSYDNSRQVQLNLIQNRLERIDRFIEEHNSLIGEQQLSVIRDTTNKKSAEARLEELRHHAEILEEKKEFLRKMREDILLRLHMTDQTPTMGPRGKDYLEGNTHPLFDFEAHRPSHHSKGEFVDPSTLGDRVSDFNNRFVIHNPQIKWNNALRNTMLRYMHQVSQRRGFVYYNTRRAVKFIIDIIEEQRSRRSATASTKESNRTSATDMHASDDNEAELQDRIEQLLKDGKKFVDADDPDSAKGAPKQASGVDSGETDLAHGFVAQNTYHVRFVAPQIQLQSLKDTKSAVLVTSRGMRLKVFEIMDEDRMSDSVSGLVQRRFCAEMDNLQFFVTHKESFTTDFLHMYSNNAYGASSVSQWPPWVPLEVMFDFDMGSFGSHGFSRVVERTSASLRFDKYNMLRLKYNDRISDPTRGNRKGGDEIDNAIDHLWIDFPRLRALCDSDQYYAMYIIVVDLLMYSEPLEKTRNERLEKILLASDFSDLAGAPELVTSLQDRLRQLEEIKTHFHVNEKYLDKKGWEDRIAVDQDIASCEDELFFMMKAITTSQRKSNDRLGGSQVTGLLRYYFSSTEIVWHLQKESDQPLAEFQLRHAAFERTDMSDGSNHNSMEIDRIFGLNLLEHALYPEMVTAYHKNGNTSSKLKMFRVSWHMLEAVAGIPVVDHFEINLFPLCVQLEYETGRQLFEYIFPGKGTGGEGSSPFLVRHRPAQALDDEQNEQAEEAARQASLRQAESDPSFGNAAPGVAAGAGSLELRLKPTHELPDIKRSSNSAAKQSNSQGLGLLLGGYDPRRLFSQQPGATRSSNNVSHQYRPDTNGRASVEGLQTPRGDGKASKTSPAPTDRDVEKRTRFSLQTSQRSSSNESRTRSRKDAEKSDDLTQMLNRASNYMTLAYVKIPSVVLCLSYKGRGSRNFEDVHNLVFRMPTVEYRNKTWSNMDLVLALKKEIIRTLISHTGTIIGNKFAHHKPGKLQQGRLRELASSSVMLASNNNLSSGNSDGPHTPRLRPAASISEDGLGDAESSSPRNSDVTSGSRKPASSYASSLSPTPEETFEELGAMSSPERDPGGHGFSGRRQSHVSDMTTTGPRSRDTTVQREGEGHSDVRRAISRRITSFNFTGRAGNLRRREGGSPLSSSEAPGVAAKDNGVAVEGGVGVEDGEDGDRGELGSSYGNGHGHAPEKGLNANDGVPTTTATSPPRTRLKKILTALPGT
ncbi:MAG: hypothetical protein M1831_007475 [Alyxoria varia]|nr:MAG: hypothetical protein M1831_007475 [Alyxoria varia]